MNVIKILLAVFLALFLASLIVCMKQNADILSQLSNCEVIYED